MLTLYVSPVSNAGQIVLCAGGDIGPFSVFSGFIGFKSQVPTGAARSSRYDL